MNPSNSDYRAVKRRKPWCRAFIWFLSHSALGSLISHLKGLHTVTRVDGQACVRSATGAQCGISRPSVLHIVTPSWAVPFLRGQLRYLTQRGFDVLVSSAPGRELQAVTDEEGIRAIAIPIARQISPWKDLFAFVHLFML